MITINKRKLITALLTLFLLTVIIMLISYFFVTQKKLIGPVLIILGFLSLLPLRLFNIPTDILKAETKGGDICGTLYPKEEKLSSAQKCIICNKEAKHIVYVAKSY